MAFSKVQTFLSSAVKVKQKKKLQQKKENSRSSRSYFTLAERARAVRFHFFPRAECTCYCRCISSPGKRANAKIRNRSAKVGTRASRARYISHARTEKIATFPLGLQPSRESESGVQKPPGSVFMYNCFLFTCRAIASLCTCLADSPSWNSAWQLNQLVVVALRVIDAPT